MTDHRYLYLACALCGLIAVAAGCSPPGGPTNGPPSPAAGTTPTSAPTPSTLQSPTPTQSPSVTPTSPATNTPTIALSTPTNPPGPSIPQEAASAVTAAKTDLARRAGVPAAQIGVASVVAAQWPSTALGCPEPGMAYAQVIVDGFRIVLTAGGKEYEYHSDSGSRVVLCQ